MRWLAIANPAAGRARDAERALARLRRAAGLRHEVAHTAGPGDATSLARRAAGFDGLIAVGGDGTIGEVLHGMDLARQRLAVLPAGHGNCLARDLGVSNTECAVASLQRNACRPLDLMEVRIGFADGREEQRLCASTLAVGYVADVVMLGRRRLHALGRAAYAAAAMLVVPRRFEARLGEDGGRAGSRRLTGVVINNTAHLANFRGLPDASTHDGLLDIMEQGHGWPRQLLHNLAVLAGSRACGPLCLRQVAAQSLELESPRTLMADGELLHEVTRLRVACRPAAVNCVVGQG
jgi:diacylglycerol kinase family enzyme